MQQNILLDADTGPAIALLNDHGNEDDKDDDNCEDDGGIALFNQCIYFLYNSLLCIPTPQRNDVVNIMCFT